ncbi:MAG TPA: 50S ribosomal protein L25 [Candidatus Andersenbacteria bacterium]|nr:50S ribosomal protein L25 [Candidatus Andersenbacteria bacterium]
MAEVFTIAAQTRDSHLGELRRAGNIPAVLYGHGIEPQSVLVEAREFMKLLPKAGYTTIINLKLDDKKEHPVFIRDVQFHPVKSTVLHIDFYQVRMDEKVTAKVPLKFIGDAPAVKDLAGTLVRSMDELEVEALPIDLPHELEVDISTLKDFDTVLHVSNISLPKGVVALQEADEVIALVQPPRSEAELESLSEEVKEDVEAVEGVKKEEPVEGEEGAEAAASEEKKGE